MSSAMVKSGFVAGGAVLGLLVILGYTRFVGPLPCQLTDEKPCPVAQKQGSSANDTPVTAHGGSFSIHGSLEWQKKSDTVYQTPFYKGGGNATPNLLSLDGVDITPGSSTNPVSADDIKPTGNWKIEIAFRDNPTTTLKICSAADCTLGNAGADKTIYLVEAANGNFQAQSIDRNKSNSNDGTLGSIFYDPPNCSPTAANRHPPCEHPKTVTVSAYVNGSATPTTYGPYQCVDGVCSIGFDNQ